MVNGNNFQKSDYKSKLRLSHFSHLIWGLGFIEIEFLKSLADSTIYINCRLENITSLYCHFNTYVIIVNINNSLMSRKPIIIFFSSGNAKDTEQIKGLWTDIFTCVSIVPRAQHNTSWFLCLA